MKLLSMKYVTLLLLCVFLFLVSFISSCEESCVEITWYEDYDGDGFGNAEVIKYNCKQPLGYVANNEDKNDTNASSNYVGSASITQGLATEILSDNLYPSGERIAGLGTIEAIDRSIWTVPAEVNYTNNAFPIAPDLFNPQGIQNLSEIDALGSFKDEDIVEIESGGEIITGYIFADNYFELYINGVAVGKDAIPFTPFNSHMVKFKVSRPFTIAMLLVDWEENLGLGSENNNSVDYHPGDGGMVAVFKDKDTNIIAVTGGHWKAQTFYIAPIKKLSCVVETDTTRNTKDCDVSATKDGADFYALHWALPTDWMNKDFNDANWPYAVTYTNNTVGVNNKEAYTTFDDIFDDPENNAQFIWTSNLILDNKVIVRYTVN